jgi:hypothetical protein
MIEEPGSKSGSGSIPLTNGSESGRPKTKKYNIRSDMEKCYRLGTKCLGTLPVGVHLSNWRGWGWWIPRRVAWWARDTWPPPRWVGEPLLPPCSPHPTSPRCNTDRQSNREGHHDCFSVCKQGWGSVPTYSLYKIRIQYSKKFLIRIRLQKLKIPHYAKIC